MKFAALYFLLFEAAFGSSTAYLCGVESCAVGMYCCSRSFCVEDGSGSRACHLVTREQHIMSIGLLIGLFAGVPGIFITACCAYCIVSRCCLKRSRSSQNRRQVSANRRRLPTVCSIQLQQRSVQYPDEPPQYSDLHKTYSVFTPPPEYKDACKLKHSLEQKTDVLH